MPEYYIILKKILLGAEFIAALVGFIYFFKLKNNYWKWFSIYLIFIFIQEYFWFIRSSSFFVKKEDYYAFLGIPLQYIFLYWLYAFKSLKKRKLFYVLSFIYLFTYIPFQIFLKKINVVYSINLTTGTILLLFLIVLEFIEQIKNDDILKFKENKMFYINIGVLFSYIGTYPFFAFYDYLLKDEYANIWNIYFLYFLITTSIMYLLFTASFIWGKHKS
ncbi:hypothetical protein RRF68_03350 [Tenacibaculum sp. HL-MS23]|uniref:hypothetical protein n=1 Tax=Tenacibaculum sp. HL-MS23 TaxID=3077734 RepID=UPI0028FC15A8|nr:hypothetical protein [Tenacibaculum sp. HL-MS23]WNW02475.1 hypothetical protein RRF68_03350 [Tenacibaculum sp. HL-MS23]